MTVRRAVVRKILGFADGWNHEIHQAIEEKILENCKDTFPLHSNEDLLEHQERIREMRSFYYARISTTANLLIAAMALVVAVFALIAACIPLFTNS